MWDMRRIDLRLLVALDALLDERSVTRAADRLALTQPTVSGMLARLRKLFGDPLFVRTQHGIQPTPRAQALAPSLKQWLAEGGNLVAGSTFEPATARLTASISANDYIQSALLVPFVERLRRQAPGIRLAVRPPELNKLTHLLANGELDIGLTTSPEIPSLDLPSRPLYDEHYVAVVRSRHPLRGRRVTLEQFCRYPHVLVSPEGGGFLGPTDQALATVGARRDVSVSVPGFLILPEILESDDLIAVVPSRVLHRRMSGLRRFAPPVEVPGFSVIAIWHQRVHKDPAHRWLRELLAETARAVPAAPVDRRKAASSRR